MKNVLLVSLGVLLMVLFTGCSDEDSLSTNSISSDSLVSLIVAINESGRIVVSSPDGEIYTGETIQRVIEVAAKEGRAFEVNVANEPFLGQAEDLLRDFSLAPPRSSLVKIFISDITPVRDGMAVTLTDIGLSFGLSWNSAWTLACYTMFEYELQEPSCANWPSWYYQAVREQVRLELYYHCLAFYYWHSPRFRTVNISIGSLP